MDFICRQKDFFKNPNKLPLNELQLKTETCKKLGKVPKDKDLEKLRDSLAKLYNVKTEKIPALDPQWIEKDRSYHKFQPYYSELSKDENDLFLQRNKLFLSDLKFLLRCTYHQFWNYLVFEPRIGLILDSFLMSPVPLYEIKHLEGEFMDLYTDIYEHVARLFLRMLNFKESETEFMSEVVTLRYLKDGSLITFPKILSLCSLYNKMCQSLVNKLADIYFTKPRFAKEIRSVLEHTLLIFEMVGGQVCGFEEDAVVIPIAIRQKPKRFDPYWVEEVVTYLLDTAVTLNAFLSNCEAAVDMGLQMGIPHRLSFFYNKVYPALYELLQDRADLPYNWTELKARVHNHIGLGRSEFVNVFHIFVSNLIDKVIQTLGDNEKQDNYLECYLKMITSSLEDEFFVFNYHNTHPIDVQILTISDFYPSLDRTRSDYILECLSTIPTLQEVLSEQQNSEGPPIKNELFEAAGTSKQYNGLDDVTIMKSSQPTPSEIDERVQSVLDALPHLGDGFILKCLEAFNYNATDVISAILDERLPSYLNDYPRDLIRIPPEPEPEQPILAYRGKKPTYKDATLLLNDKSEMQGIKEFISKISSQDIYDDEYDDRDEEDSTLRFYDRNDEVSVYKHMGNRFEGYELVSDPSESSEEEEEESVVDKRKGAFCEDPAAVRARYESGRRGKPSSKPKNANVVGKPKGQGQDASVTRSRDKKTVNKSSRANHNRKGGAQWKRNKGMIPS